MNLLLHQQDLSAVEAFSASSLHDSALAAPAQSQYYRNLIPLSKPGPGEQYSFEVDLDTCSGCKACVVACHTLNGLEEDETWRRVGLLTGEDPVGVSQIHHTTTACHHCVDPGCLSGCPVKAYDKDPETGIVRHLDDQCIGCQYCTMMCPYEVPQYSHKKGIVRKCDMCHQRLAVGEAPACVQACPNEAIAIRIVDTETVKAGIDSSTTRLVPGAPLSSITKPTTSYRTQSASIDQSISQDAHTDDVAASHWPLAIMLVMTQLSVGMFACELLVRMVTSIDAIASRNVLTAAALIGVIGAHVAMLHLGRPLVAFRAFLGWRTSWMSREILTFGGYMGAASTIAILLWLPELVAFLPEGLLPEKTLHWAAQAVLPTQIATIVSGLVGIGCSGMIYIATRRPLWRSDRTMTRFFGSMLVLGPATIGSLIWIQGTAWQISLPLLGLAAASLIAKLGWEWKILLSPKASGDVWDDRSRRLVHRALVPLRVLRVASAGIGIACLVPATISASFGSTTVTAALLLISLSWIIVGEAAERLLYFTSVVYDRMPGAMR